MSGEFSVPVSVPIDADGFLRRECPTCEREFKWFAHEEGSGDAEHADQYFCPLCGVAAAADQWWTAAQAAYAEGAAGPTIDQFVQDSVSEAFKGMKGITFESSAGFSLGIPTPEPLSEPNDMVIVEPPCHPNEPLKVPEERIDRVYCLICGAAF